MSSFILGRSWSREQAGTIGSIVDTVHPMHLAAEAHRRFESERRVGAIVIAIADAGEAD